MRSTLLSFLLLLVGMPEIGLAEQRESTASPYSAVALWERGPESLMVQIAVGDTVFGPYRWSVVEGPAGRTTLCWQTLCRSHLHEEGIVIVDRFEEGIGLLPTRAVAAEQVAEHYRVEVLPDESRWGRSIAVQRLVPHDDWRFAQRWWIDRASQVVVERRFETADGVPLERFALVRFVPTAGLSFLEVRQQWAALGRLEAVDLRLHPLSPDQMPGQLTDLPPGFRLVSCGVRRGPSGQPVWQWIVSDGAVTLSLFAEALGTERDESAAALPSERIGATGIVRQIRSGWAQTAIGEAPDKTLTRLLQGVVWSTKEGGRP